jgi:hypothetical protein
MNHKIVSKLMKNLGLKVRLERKNIAPIMVQLEELLPKYMTEFSLGY